MPDNTTASLPNTEWEYLHKRRFDIRLRCLTNRFYQQDRARVHELREGLVKAASLIAGSVAIAAIGNPDIVRWCAAVVFCGTAASLVFGWGPKARDAGRRAAEWTSLERDIEAAGERRFTEVQVDTWAARCNEIENGEPAPNKVLLERTYRRACQSLGVQAATGGPLGANWRPYVVLP
jgi:hypothetical protein